MTKADSVLPRDTSSGSAGLFPESRPLHVEIDLSAFRHNIAQVRKLAIHSSPLLVLKANAYGHGLVELAKEADGCDIAVAVSSECNDLIESNISSVIWVLEGPFSDQCLVKSGLHSIVWVIHSVWQVDLIESFAASHPDINLKLCLKVNSGMNRLGFAHASLLDANQRMSACPNIELVATMTHFSSSDEPHNAVVDDQNSIYRQILKDSDLDNLPKSLCNSGGILYYREYHADIVRPGIMLYGGMPTSRSDAMQHNLKPVMKLKSAVIATQTVLKGESVGYGCQWVANCESRIAIVAGGYGDGYPRHAASGTPVAVYDRKTESMKVASLAGRVSMDMIAIDVTAFDVRVGDEVELWGDTVSADAVAAKSDTISYELFCNISNRVPRKYV